MRKSLLIVGAVFVVIAIIIIFYPIQRREGYLLLYPQVMIGQQYTTYDISDRPNEVISSVDTSMVAIGMATIDNLGSLVDFYNKYQYERGFSTPQESIVDTINRDGFNADQFSFTINQSNASISSALDSFYINAYDLYGPLWYSISRLNQDHLADLVAQVFIFKKNESYYTVGWQYESRNYTEAGNVTRLEYVYSMDYPGLPRLLPGQSVSCIYTTTEYGIAAHPVDIFNCDGVIIKSSLIMEDQIQTTPKDKTHLFTSVDECSIGSLWQQFACRYLGQSKYDEDGNLKPEARVELGG